MNKTKCIICSNEVYSNELQAHELACMENKSAELYKLNYKIKVDLTKHQQLALEYSQQKAKEYSLKAYDSLTNKFTALQMNEKDMNSIINYLVNVAPLIIHINLDDNLEHLCNDIYYRTQLQNGIADHQKKLFNNLYNNTNSFHTVKYGVFNLTNDLNGVNSCIRYGDSSLLLRNNIKNRTTLLFNNNKEIGTFDNLYHILNQLPDDLLIKLFKLSIGEETSYPSEYDFYIECQFHGEILIERDVEGLFVNRRHIGDNKIANLLTVFNEKHKSSIVWI